MSDPADRIEHRFYGDLAPWWPLISPPAEYAEEAAFAADLLAADGATASVLELGSGGGHVASHLADRFRLTLVDLSEPMLQVSRALNPTAGHHQGLDPRMPRHVVPPVPLRCALRLRGSENRSRERGRASQ